MVDSPEGRLGVIADDITGANDAGVQFMKRGLETIVLLEAASLLPKTVKEGNVIVVDTESRFSPPDIAYQRVRDVVKILNEASVRVVYKKIDSTLRGNIGSELEAIMEEAGFSLSIVAPAFPSNLRITVGGIQLVNHVPVEKTEFSQDPSTPVKISHVPSLMQTQMKRKVGHVALPTVLEGRKSLEKAVREKYDDGNEVIVVDASTDSDLKAIARVSMDLNALPCGSAGLAGAVSDLLGSRGKRSVFVASGSVSEVTMRQITRAEEASKSCVVDMEASAVLKYDGEREKELLRVVRDLKTALSEGKDVILRTAKSKADVEETQRRGRDLGLREFEVGERVSSTLAEIVERIVQSGEVAGLVLTGGDTAARSMRRIGASGVRITGELLPGIPVCSLIGGKCHGLETVTKAGGFGGEDALTEIIRFLKGRF